MFQQYEKLKGSSNDPQEFLKEITGKYNKDQMQAFQKFANGFGITNEQLSKYGINAK